MGGEIRKKVSCHVITYNHVNYIQKCIDGILMQKTDFDFEIIIGDDVSTDGTREIVERYAAEHPDRIKLNLRQKRGTGIPGKENFVSTLEMCTGEYISLCDGDDYWTDPLKLQKQVDFLEKNKDYVLCFHKVKILTTEGKLLDDFITEVPKNYEFRNTLAENSNYIHTPSVVFRNILDRELNSVEFFNAPIGDYFLYMFLTLHGKIGYIEEHMAIYRYGVGVFSSSDYFNQLKASILLFTNLYSCEKDPVIKKMFYNHLQYVISEIESQYFNHKRLLSTRRHMILEKVYNKLKRK